MIRAEIAAVGTAFDKFPTLASTANKPLVVNAAGTAVTTTTGTLALAGNFATAGAYAVTLTFTGATGVTFPTTGTLATLAGSETFTNKTLTSPVMTAPVLGTPASGNLSNCTAYPTAQLSGLGANVATFLATPSSANLAAAVTGETGTGALVFAENAVLVAPALGTPASGVATNITGLPEAGLTLADNTTNDSSTSKHGFLKKLSNVATEFMNGTGAWSTPNAVVAYSALTNSSASGASVVFTGLTSEDLIVYLEGVSIAAGTAQLNIELSTDNGSSYVTAAMPVGLSNSLDTTAKCTLIALTGAKVGFGVVHYGASGALTASAPPNVQSSITMEGALFWLSASVNAIRVSTSASTFNAGTIFLKGRG